MLATSASMTIEVSAHATSRLIRTATGVTPASRRPPRRWAGPSPAMAAKHGRGPGQADYARSVFAKSLPWYNNLALLALAHA